MTLNNSNDSPFVATQHSIIKGEITWTNNLSDTLNNTVIDLVMASPYLDQSSVVADNGFYNSNTNTLEWNADQNTELQTIKPGATGKVTFQFSSKDLSGAIGASIEKPNIDLSVSVKGRRFNENNVPEDITGTLSQTVVIAADLDLDAEVSNNQSPFQDTGPIPPKVGVPTTYTITFVAKDTLNDVKNAYITATLPNYVNWQNQVSPALALVTYNPVTRQVRYDIGSITAGSGYTSTAPQVSFQVSITPSISQLGNNPELVDGVTLFGGDTFTGKEIQTSPQNLTTFLANDSGGGLENARVVQ